MYHKMGNMKKTILIVLTILLLLSVTACGNTEESTSVVKDAETPVMQDQKTTTVLTAQLVEAVKNNEITKVRELIQQKADVNAVDDKGNSLLIVASAEGYTDVVAALLESGADVKAVDSGMQATALHAAAYRCFPRVMELLVKYGIDINAVGPKNGYTALHDSVWQNNIEGVKILVGAGAKRDIRGKDGKTPLDLAKKNGNKEIIAILEN